MSMNIAKNDLIGNLSDDKEYRDLFVAEHINRTVAFQIRATREAQHMTQTELGERVGMAQARISLLEDANYGSFAINTLKRIASTLDVALVVRFVPFSQLATWVAGQSQVIPGLSVEAMAVSEFKEDMAELRQREERAKPSIPESIQDLMTGARQGEPGLKRSMEAERKAHTKTDIMRGIAQ